MLTGGISVKGTAPGYHFQIWEDGEGQEYTYSPSFRPADPLDQHGYVYLPHDQLIVLATPDGRRLVIGESQSQRVVGIAGLSNWLKTKERALEQTQLPPRTMGQQLARWKRTLLHIPYMQLIYVAKGTQVYRGMAFGGKVHALYLVPDLSNVAPDATASISGVAKVISYVSGYDRIVLDDLTFLADPKLRPLPPPAIP